MADTLESLQADLAALRKVRASGNRRVEYVSGAVEHRSDAELASAIADIEGRIAALGNRGPVRQTYLKSSKGI